LWNGSTHDGEFTGTGTSFTPNRLLTERKYYYEGSLRVAMRTLTYGVNTLNFLLSDHLGSTNVTLAAEWS
jgi:hypothetical protein